MKEISLEQSESMQQADWFGVTAVAKSSHLGPQM